MKRGIDVGSHGTKEYIDENNFTNIRSLVTTKKNVINSSTCLEYEGVQYFIGEGKYETEPNKANRKNFIPLLLGSLSLGMKNSNDIIQQVVCGLPINQCEANKEELKEIVLKDRVKEIILNGEEQKIIISDFEVYPEAIGAYYSLGIDDDVIIVDIGGRTTDIVHIENKKVKVHSTVSAGTINIYKDIADKLNAAHTLDLDIMNAERIIDKGYFEIDGERADLGFVIEILKDNFDKINEDLILKFPIRTQKIILVGGGYKLFQQAFKKRYKNSYVAVNPIYANAIGFRKVAEMLW